MALCLRDHPLMAGGMRHDKMVELVERMLDPSAGSELALRDSKGQALHRQMPKAKIPHEQESLKHTIAVRRGRDRLSPSFNRRLDNGARPK